MKAQVLFCLLIVILPGTLCHGIGAPVAVGVTAEMAANRSFLLGEPFQIQCALKSNETVVLPMKPVPADPDLLLEVQSPDGTIKSWANSEVPPSLPIRPPYTLKPEEAVRWDFSLFHFKEHLCSPGHYQVRVRYRVDPRWEANDPEVFKLFWKGEAVSGWVAIEIAAPQGTDETIWKQFLEQVPANQCREFENWLGSKREDILSRFPTSTYAGYALLSAGQCIPDPVMIVRERSLPAETTARWPETAPQMQREEKERLAYNEKRVSQLETYLKARHDFNRAGCLRLELAARLAYLERYKEAQSIFDELLKKAPESEEGKKARRLREYLVSKGWIKDTGS